LPTSGGHAIKDTDAADDRSALPPVVTPEEWQQARDALLARQLVVYHLMPLKERGLVIALAGTQAGEGWE
jgi:hypothetical protein